MQVGVCDTSTIGVVEVSQKGKGRSSKSDSSTTRGVPIAVAPSSPQIKQRRSRCSSPHSEPRPAPNVSPPRGGSPPVQPMPRGGHQTSGTHLAQESCAVRFDSIPHAAAQRPGGAKQSSPRGKDSHEPGATGRRLETGRHRTSWRCNTK
jgi:hypothetical protein